MNFRAVIILFTALFFGLVLWTGEQTLTAPQSLYAQEDFSCANVSEIPQSECEVLVALYYSTADSGQFGIAGWLTTTTPCSWPNIICEDGNVTELVINFNDLTSLPPEIGNLSALTWLDVYGNQLTNLPPEIGNLSALTWLDAGGNSLTSLPSEIGNLSSLTWLWLFGSGLTSLPSEIGNLSSLTQLSLYSNQLTNLPPEIGDLSALTWLDVGENNLTSLPSEIGNLSALTTLDVSLNQLTSLPSEIGNMAALSIISTGGNPSEIQPVEISTESVPTESSGTIERSMPGPFYAQGSSVQLTAVPASGWRFDYWDGPDGRRTDLSISVIVGLESPTYTAHFVADDPLSIRGNVDCDNDMDPVDALFVLQYEVGQRNDSGSCPLEDRTTQLYAAGGDLNSDGQTTAIDALFILQCVVGLPNEYCGVNAASVSDNGLIRESESIDGPVDVRVSRMKQTVHVQLDAMNGDVAVGSFELRYDSSRTRLVNCALAGQGACHERADGVIRFAFIDPVGLRGTHAIAELTFDSADLALTAIEALTLTDSAGRELAAEVTMEQSLVEQEPSGQADQSAVRLLVPLFSR